jgi:glutamate N-acetyltransferase/amino-acid N-acetyltransferase
MCSLLYARAAQVCKKLADDIVRNGEGTNHVIQVTVKNAPSFLIARDMGRAVVNSPLFKCAIAGNDPNVGRLLAAVGKFIGNSDLDIPLDKVRSVTSASVALHRLCVEHLLCAFTL